MGKGTTVAMSNSVITTSLSAAALAFCLGASLGSNALGQEYCVSCTGPDAVYRCVIEKAAPTGVTLKQLCVGTLARQGRHANCAVRGGTVFDCDAPIRRIDARSAASVLSKPATAPLATTGTPPPSAPPLPPAAAQPPPLKSSNTSAPPPRQESQQPQAKPEPGSAPRTVEEMAKDLSRSSGQALGKAGDAIGGTTRKAWDCVKSFFKSC